VFAGDNASHFSKRTLSAGPSFSSGNTVTLSPSTFTTSAPLVGEGGLAYILGHDGVLHVVDTATMMERWSWTNGSIPATGLSQLNIDVNRDVADPCKAGEPGVLYFSASSASSTKVYALLVDSQGVPRTAAWPRYQHDPGNTGNAATDLTPWSCR
jgi:outer membrane protein assembly factor BamB